MFIRQTLGCHGQFSEILYMKLYEPRIFYKYEKVIFKSDLILNDENLA